MTLASRIQVIENYLEECENEWDAIYREAEARPLAKRDLQKLRRVRRDLEDAYTSVQMSRFLLRAGYTP